MDVVHYLPGDPVLIDQIVCELKSQGIFDSFRKECISDVDTKPAYQNLRQRVEGSVSGFLRKQRWSPEMNKNHVREMLRKNIYESGFLEIGVERIVDQVVNPKMNTVFLPKVTEVVYKFLGIEKPNKSEKGDVDDNLLPNDLEAVSPMSDRNKDEKMDISESMDESKIDEDESPPFEPIEEPENSIDSHMSGFSGLVSHDSNQSDGAKPLQIDMDSQMSKQSSDGGQSSAVEDQKIENSEDSKSCESSDKSMSSKGDKGVKVDDKKDGKDKEKSRRTSEKKSDKHSSRGERRDSERSRDKERKDSKSDKDRRHSSSSKHSSSKSKSSSSKDSSRHRDEKSKSSSHSKHDSHRKSSSSSSHGRDKDKDKKDNKKRSRDDHYSSKHRSERRSTDRDSNDGSGLKSCSSSSNCESNSSTQTSTTQNNSKPQDSNSNSNDSGNSDGHEVNQKSIKLIKPKIASNMQEAKRLAKIRKEIDHLEKLKNEELEKLKIQELEKAKEEEKIVEKQSFSASLLSWEAMEAQLSQTLNYDSYGDPDKSNDDDDMVTAVKVEEVKYLNDTTVEEEANYRIGQETISKLTIDISTLKKKMEENMSVCPPTDNCRENKENKRTGIKRKLYDNKAYEKAKNNNNFINGSDCYVLVSNHHVDERFSLPLSPADSDQVDDEEKPKRNIVKRQRYESEDLYKPRPTITPTSRRRTATKLE